MPSWRYAYGQKGVEQLDRIETPMDRELDALSVPEPPREGEKRTYDYKKISQPVGRK